MSLARLLVTITLVVVFSGSLASHAAGRQGLAVVPPRVVQPHELVDQHAHEVTFPSGMWQLVLFGHLPDVCPMTLHKTKLLLDG
jgi:cytochrome oxidase Cu insertion factor (SCO1/SenC/PrrC family)